MTATKHATGEAATTATHRSLNVNFLHRAEQGITPSEAVPSLVDLELAAGNDSNNTLIWTWHDNEPAAIAETTMTAEPDRKEVWSWKKQGSSGNQGSNKQWWQQHIDPNCGNWGSQRSSGNNTPIWTWKWASGNQGDLISDVNLIITSRLSHDLKLVDVVSAPWPKVLYHYILVTNIVDILYSSRSPSSATSLQTSYPMEPLLPSPNL